MSGNNYFPELKGKSDKRRLVAALNHEKTDRAPNFEIVIMGRSVSNIMNRNDSGTINMLPVEDQLELARRIGQDAVPCPLSYYPSVYGLIHERGDEKKLVFPDPAEKYLKLKKHCDFFKNTEVGVIAQLTGCMAPAYMSYGPVPIQDFLCLLYDDEEYACFLMELFRDYTLRIINAVKDLPFDAFYIGDDLGSNNGPLISPEMIKNLWAPRMKEIMEAAKALNKPVIFHCCGDQGPILPYMQEWKINAVHPLQPPVNDIYKIAAEYGDVITMVGNIDVATTLTFGTPDEVYEDTRKHIEKLGRNGGYVVCSSHSIIDSIPPENYLSMIKAAHDGF